MPPHDKTSVADGTSGSVVLVGFQDQGNLGLGYLAAVLIKHGFDVHTVDFNEGPDNILRCIREHRPVVIGLSLIFQYYLPKFSRLVKFLRSRGVGSHITVGGHYPSLCYEQTLQQMPELDSVVLFEGEQTLLDLTRKLAGGGDWQSISGIAYRADGGPVRNHLRRLTSDLDQLPFPYRPSFTAETLGEKIQPILATRGCPRSCTFCSIREFYSQAPGKLVRRRSPANVVLEMKELYEDHGVAIFLFQDDDFPVVGKPGRQWVQAFLNELGNQDLLGRVIWKISCRVDEVDAQLFSEMRDGGLYVVYLGIESGTNDGLKMLRKQVAVADILSAVATLKQLDIMFGYGFMLFDPGSTFESVRLNIGFLRKIIGDGCAPVIFCKMLPYAGTPIENELRQAGRLRGSSAQPDYVFLEGALDEYYEKLNDALNEWVHGPNAVSHFLNTAWHEVAVIERLFPRLAGLTEYRQDLRRCTKNSNERVFHTVETSVLEFERTGKFPLSIPNLRAQAREVVETLLEQRNAFIYCHQDVLLGARQQPRSRRIPARRELSQAGR